MTTIKTAIANLFQKPTFNSPVISQILLNEPLILKKELKNWSKIESRIDEYQGWIHNSYIYKQSNKDKPILFTKSFIPLNFNNNRIILPPLFPVFQYEEKEKTIVIPVGKFPVEIEKILLFSAFEEPTVENINFIKNTILGTPYIWAGRSCFGFDCSGLTQQIMLIFGKKIPRDAYQQAQLGKNIKFQETKPGDLAFFTSEGKITHVGIVSHSDNSLTKILHASNFVKEDILTPNGIINSSEQTFLLTHKLAFIKRML